ncbi:MAG: aminotransferase class III-fold pyridoxal phosphate-dependent enzyme, partial [Planctomycetota bacterium]
MDVHALEALDFAHLWHPFTPMRQWRRRKPFIVASAEGFTLTSVEGETLLDGVSSLWCNVHGHRVHELDEAVRDQLGRVAHSTLLGLSAEPAIRLAARLAELAQRIPGDGAPLDKVFFSDAGATATEAALKMAIGAQRHAGDAQRTTVVTLSGGYHGDTVGAMSMG